MWVNRWIIDQLMDFPVLVLGWQRALRCTQCARVCGRLTGDGESVVSDLRRDVDASSPFRVIRPAQARDVGDTSLVDVHHTV